MPNLLCFSRNRCTTVESIAEQTLLARCRLQDTTMDLSVEVTVILPDIEIADIKGEVFRSPYQRDFQALESLKTVVGVRVGPGLKKIISGLMGEAEGKSQLAFMVEECCNAVIISFTRQQMSDRVQDGNYEEYFYNLARENPRMYNRCAAFAPGSPLVDGIEPR
jgi:hypothetical protein